MSHFIYCNAESHYAECRILFIVTLSVIMLNAIVLNVIMLSVIMLNANVLIVMAPHKMEIYSDDDS